MGGGVFNFTTKSGSNQFHGTAYDYLVNEVFNAGQPFTNDGHGDLLRPRQRRNDYGFTLGGPLWRKRQVMFGCKLPSAFVTESLKMGVLAESDDRLECSHHSRVTIANTILIGRKRRDFVTTGMGHIRYFTPLFLTPVRRLASRAIIAIASGPPFHLLSKRIWLATTKADLLVQGTSEPHSICN